MLGVKRRIVLTSDVTLSKAFIFRLKLDES
jgi:hypothetical protein